MQTAQKAETDLLLNELCEYHVRLAGYAAQARLELMHNIARLFEALSFSKQVQALYILKHTGCIGSTRENLSGLTAAEGAGVPGKDCGSAGEPDTRERFHEIEEKNRHLYTCAKDAVESESDMSIGDINVCSRCGNVVIGSPSKECTACRSPRGYFRPF